MARQESDREDLMAEATALVRRIELAVPGEPAYLVAGERADGRISLYFGPDPVYHFDDQNRLRRAYVDGTLFRTQGDTLARLTRVRTPDVTELRRHDLTGAELEQFFKQMKDQLTTLQEALTIGRAETVRQVPDGEDFRVELAGRLVGLLQSTGVLAPPIKAKRS